jgi:hypothetical protein
MIQSGFDLSIRFFGTTPSPEQQALFTAAAARIRAMIISDLAPVSAPGVDLAAFCETPGLPVINETIDDMIIYASVSSIDGPGGVLAQAGPCAIRDDGGTMLPIIGIMQFDVSDLGTMAGEGSLQDVITHEMMHVVGLGVYWTLGTRLSGYNTSNVAFTGLAAITHCRAAGGTAICATNVPVENTGGPGTANGHWRESVFVNELMTGYINAGAMPVSAMTIGSFQDIGYQVNIDAAAAYRIPGTAPAATLSAAIAPASPQLNWERVVAPKVLITKDGRTRKNQ